MKIYDLRFTIYVLFALAAVCASGQPTPIAPATQAEVNAGTLHSKFVAPDTLTGWSGGGTNGGGNINTNFLRNFSLQMSGGPVANLISNLQSGCASKLIILGDSYGNPFDNSAVGNFINKVIRRDNGLKGYGIGYLPCADIGIGGGTTNDYKNIYWAATNYWVPTGGTVTNGLVNFNGDNNLLEVFYSSTGATATSGNNNFNVKIATNGGSFFTVTNIVCNGAGGTNSRYAAWPVMARGDFQVVIESAVGTNHVLGIAMIDSNPVGWGTLTPYYLGCSGSDFAQSTNARTLVSLSNVVAQISAQSVGGSTTVWVAFADTLSGYTAIEHTNNFQWLSSIGVACGNRMLLQGPYFSEFLQGGDNNTTNLYNTTAESMALHYVAYHYGFSFFDSHFANESMTNQFNRGWQQDDVHMNDTGGQALSDAMLAAMNLDLTVKPMNRLEFNLGDGLLLNSATYGEGDGSTMPGILSQGGTGGAVDFILPPSMNWATQIVFSATYYANVQQMYTNQYFSAYLNGSGTRTIVDNFLSPITIPGPGSPTSQLFTNTWPVTNMMKSIQINFRASTNVNTRQLLSVKGVATGPIR